MLIIKKTELSVPMFLKVLQHSISIIDLRAHGVKKKYGPSWGYVLAHWEEVPRVPMAHCEELTGSLGPLEDIK